MVPKHHPRSAHRGLCAQSSRSTFLQFSPIFIHLISFEVLSWVAVHDAAKVILELRHTKEPFIHLTNPRPIRAADIFGAIADNLQLPLVPYSEWLMAVDAAHRSRGSDSVACMVLVDFCRAAYRPHSPSADFGEAFGFTSADCSRAAVAAPSRGDIAQLGPRDIETWLNYWRRNSVIRQ